MSGRRWAPETTTRAATALVLAAFIASCGAAPPADDEQDPTTLTVLYPDWSEDMFSPSWDMAEDWILYPGMAERDSLDELVPVLADRWEPSEGFRAWTVHLREDARWHDGTPVTARDVEFTTDLWYHPDVMLETRIGALDSTVIVDDQTVRFHYRRPVPLLYWESVYPKHLLDTLPPASFHEWEIWRRPVGYGPYRFVRVVPGQLMELEANPDWWRGRPRIDRLILRFGGGNPLVELLAGNVDALPNADAATVQKLRDHPDFEVYYSLGTHWLSAILWNHRSPLFSDARVRRALTLALDRPALNAMANIPPEVRLFDGIFTRRDYVEARTPEALPHDSAAAVRLLEEAGWRDTDGDGMRDRNGVPFRFELMTTPNPEMGSHGSYGLLIQEQLARYGIRVELVRLTGAVIRERVRAGEFDAVIERFRNTLLGSSHAVRHFLGEGSPLGYRDEELLEIIRRAEGPLEPGDGAALIRRASEIMRRDLPVTFLAPGISFTAVHERVKGLASPHLADPMMVIDRIWIEEEGR